MLRTTLLGRSTAIFASSSNVNFEAGTKWIGFRIKATRACACAGYWWDNERNLGKILLQETGSDRVAEENARPERGGVARSKPREQGLGLLPTLRLLFIVFVTFIVPISRFMKEEILNVREWTIKCTVEMSKKSNLSSVQTS